MLTFSLNYNVTIQYKNGVQFTTLNHYGTLKVKQIHFILVISAWLKLFHYNIIM
jgi:hypothetical protein